MRLSYAVRERVTDMRDASKVGTVLQTVGTMFRDSAVLVHWDYLGYTNWEIPRDIRPADSIEKVSA